MAKTTAKERISRRQFIRASAQTAGLLSFPYLIREAALAAGAAAPSNRITVGSIGIGGMGRGHLRELVRRPDVRVLALCDVNKNNLDRAIETVSEAYGKNDCAVYRNFRELLARTDIDAVFIATPDHWHSIPAIEAAKAGKDIYSEKPLSLTVAEGKAMVKAARFYNRVFQTGSQQRSGYFFRHGCELVRNGYIGQVKSILVGVQGHARDCDLPAEPVPDYIDWDMWLGPAPFRPYNSRIARGWRSYWDYSGGNFTDWGAHQVDIAQWALGMDTSGPVEIYPPDGKRQVSFKYANGVTMARIEPADYQQYSILVEGTEGTVEMHREWLRTKPKSLALVTIRPDQIRLYHSDNHKDNFFECIRTRRRPVADVETGYHSITVCHLGNIAYRLNRPLKWDPVREQFAGDKDANRMLSRSMRSPWHI